MTPITARKVKFSNGSTIKFGKVRKEDKLKGGIFKFWGKEIEAWVNWSPEKYFTKNNKA